MVKSCITISLVPEARGGPFVFWEDLRASCEMAHQLGFEAVEIFAPAADAVDTTQLRTWLDEWNLTLAAVGTGAGWVIHRATLTASEESIRRRAKDFVKSIIDMGGPFGAPAIIGSMQGSFGGQTDRAAAQHLLVETLQELGEYASQYSTPLLYEPLNRYETNLVNTVADAAELVAGLRNVKLLPDLFHMNIEENDVAQALRTAGPLVGHVHFVDSNRRAAGFGHTNFQPIVDALHDIRYEGFLSAEAFPWPDSETAAKQTIESFRKWFASES